MGGKKMAEQSVPAGGGHQAGRLGVRLLVKGSPSGEEGWGHAKEGKESQKRYCKKRADIATKKTSSSSGPKEAEGSDLQKEAWSVCRIFRYELLMAPLPGRHKAMQGFNWLGMRDGDATLD